MKNYKIKNLLNCMYGRCDVRKLKLICFGNFFFTNVRNSYIKNLDTFNYIPNVVIKCNEFLLKSALVLLWKHFSRAESACLMHI